MSRKDLHTDNELFLQISDGDEAAFTELFNRYSNLLYWHSYKLLNSEFWAEETVQDIFMQMWAGRTGLRSVELPSSYLYRVTANRAFDRIRRQELEVKMQYFVQQQLHPPESSDPDQKADRQKMEQIMEQAIQSLPEQRRLVFQMKYQQNFSYDEIASRLNITKHTVRNQMAKALQTVRTFLFEKGNIWLLLFFYHNFF